MESPDLNILQAAIKAAFDAISNIEQDLDNPVDPNVQRQQLANDLGKAFDDHIHRRTITVNSGIPVTTTGTAATQSGATTAVGGTTIA